jgi:hypothetical protein
METDGRGARRECEIENLGTHVPATERNVAQKMRQDLLRLQVDQAFLGARASNQMR